MINIEFKGSISHKSQTAYQSLSLIGDDGNLIILIIHESQRYILRVFQYLEKRYLNIFNQTLSEKYHIPSIDEFKLSKAGPQYFCINEDKYVTVYRLNDNLQGITKVYEECGNKWIEFGLILQFENRQLQVLNLEQSHKQLIIREVQNFEFIDFQGVKLIAIQTNKEKIYYTVPELQQTHILAKPKRFAVIQYKLFIREKKLGELSYGYQIKIFNNQVKYYYNYDIHTYLENEHKKQVHIMKNNVIISRRLIQFKSKQKILRRFYENSQIWVLINSPHIIWSSTGSCITTAQSQKFSDIRKITINQNCIVECRDDELRVSKIHRQ